MYCLGILAISVLMNGCSSEDLKSSGALTLKEDRTITINNDGNKNIFSPGNIDVKILEKVIWVNNTDDLHTIVWKGPSPVEQEAKSNELQAKGDIYELEPTKAGTYNYSCGTHTGMIGGTITVRL